MLLNGACITFEPAIIDTDGALRWVNTAGTSVIIATFFDNAVYVGHGHQLYRIDLDGTVTELADYSSLGMSFFTITSTAVKLGLSWTPIPRHTSIRQHRSGCSGRVLKTSNLANIISAAMIAGGDDPSQFVYPTPTDWFHNNGVTY